MLRLAIFLVVVAVIFMRSPERKPEPAVEQLAASAAAAAAAAGPLAASPRTVIEAAHLAEAARAGLDQARRAIAPPPRP